MDCFNGHYDETSELEHCSESSDEDQLVLPEEGLSEVVNLGDQGSKANKDLHSDVKGVLVCDVLETVVLWLLDIGELINIVND